MTLDTIIEPEIINDELAAHLTALAARPDVRTIIESGSSDGRGSTMALMNGILKHSTGVGEKRLCCIEMSNVRVEALRKRFGGLPFVDIRYGSSVEVEEWYDEDYIRRYHTAASSGFSKYSLETVLDWLAEDIRHYEELLDFQRDILLDLLGLDLPHKIMAVLDGSAFSGKAEMKTIKGIADIIVLDDVCDIKHELSRRLLMDSPEYHLLAENLTLRNGYSIFERNA